MQMTFVKACAVSILISAGACGKKDDGCVEDQSTEAIECPAGDGTGAPGQGPQPGGQPGGGGATWSAPEYAAHVLQGTVDGSPWQLKNAIYQRDLWMKGDTTILDFSFMSYDPKTNGQSYCTSHAGFDATENRNLFGVSVKDQVGETNYFDGSGVRTATISYTRAGESSPHNVITDQVKVELLDVSHPRISGRIVFEFDSSHTVNGTFEAFQCDAYHARGSVSRMCVDSATGICHEMSSENSEDVPSCQDLGWSNRFSSLCSAPDIAPLKGCKKVAGPVTTVSWYPKASFTVDSAAADCSGDLVDPNFHVP